MLSFEELQSKASAEKQLLSYEEFQNQVLKVFGASKRECDFYNFSYGFVAEISYTNCQWLFFAVKYVTDPENCYYGHWICVKRYDKACKCITESLPQAVEVLAQRTEESIKEEICTFKQLKKLK
jgi:uncharacterized protein YycO